jgi:pimeloyl-ACP methyl ester carboxylesterase
MHGKTGSPYGSHLQSFYSDMADQGYDVVAPFMPWSSMTWEGDLCEAMAYIDELAGAEIAMGKEVVVVGHSMGGVAALIYGATEPPAGVAAIVPIAPGHMPHQSMVLQNSVSADVSRAKSLVDSGQGDDYDSFETRNNGTQVAINTTPNIFLSYHALDQFPDMRSVLPRIELPVLWFAGSADNLTTAYKMAELYGYIDSASSSYQVLGGTHLGVVANTPTPLGTWLSGLGI